VLAYLSGAGGTQLTWYDRSGNPGGVVGTPGLSFSSAISPDGSTVAYDRISQNVAADVWLLDLARGNETRFTFGRGNSLYPIWSPDGSRIAYSVSREGTSAVYLKSRGGSGEERPLHKTLSGNRFPLDWSRDGQFIVEGVNDPNTKQDIWVVPLAANQEPFVYLNSEFNETAGKVHPGGQWLAYVSDETGRNEVYVQTSPKPGGKFQVSSKGGGLPLWSRDGKELYYMAADANLIAVEIKTTGDTIQQPGAAKVLFPVRLSDRGVTGYAYDVAKDGHFLISTPVASASLPINVVVNWTAGLKK
jgi:eukaryotic-like serine/threonine-protein kinase